MHSSFIGVTNTSKTDYVLSIKDNKIGLEPTNCKGPTTRPLSGSYLSAGLGLVVLVALCECTSGNDGGIATFAA